MEISHHCPAKKRLIFDNSEQAKFDYISSWTTLDGSRHIFCGLCSNLPLDHRVPRPVAASIMQSWLQQGMRNGEMTSISNWNHDVMPATRCIFKMDKETLSRSMVHLIAFFGSLHTPFRSTTVMYGEKTLRDPYLAENTQLEDIMLHCDVF